MRGLEYKPRISPHTFQGLGLDGLKLLKNVCDKYLLFSVLEILDPRVIADTFQCIDIIQIGSRSMQNITLSRK